MARYKIKNLETNSPYYEYVSVTQIIDQIDKGFGFHQWIADTCVKHNDPKAWVKRGKETRDIGSLVHRIIETYIKIKINNKQPDLRILLNTHGKYIKQMFYQFLVWEKKHVKRFLESENPVVHEASCYAGTADFLYQDYNNKIWLVDLKTANGVYKNHELQISAYKIARELMEGRYSVEHNHNGNIWEKVYYYPKIRIDHIAALSISRDYFWVDFKECKEVAKRYLAFCNQLDFFYNYADRKIYNHRGLA